MSSLQQEDEEEFFLEDLEQGWYLDLKEGAGNLVSAQTLQGRILVSLSVFRPQIESKEISL